MTKSTSRARPAFDGSCWLVVLHGMTTWCMQLVDVHECDWELPRVCVHTVIYVILLVILLVVLQWWLVGSATAAQDDLVLPSYHLDAELLRTVHINSAVT